jgi:hypothetical protein
MAESSGEKLIADQSTTRKILTPKIFPGYTDHSTYPLSVQICDICEKHPQERRIISQTSSATAHQQIQQTQDCHLV